MWPFLTKWLRPASARSTSGRSARSFRPMLEELETRSLLSTAGVISAIEYPIAGQFQRNLAVFVLTADRSLWEYNAPFGQTPKWSQVSPAPFDSISATRNAEGQPVVFGILSADHSLWENNPEFDPTAPSQNDQWLQVSPGAFNAISAIFATVNGQVEPVVYGIVAGDHSLWENNPGFNPAATSLNDQWVQISPGAFTAVSATVISRSA